MPGKSNKTKTRSVRVPLDVLAELEATAAKHGVTTNEEIIRRIRDGADPYFAPPEAEGQMALPMG